MIVQCPRCSTQYRVPDARLNERRPTFKCTRCSHVFAADYKDNDPPEAERDAVPVEKGCTEYDRDQYAAFLEAQREKIFRGAAEKGDLARAEDLFGNMRRLTEQAITNSVRFSTFLERLANAPGAPDHFKDLRRADQENTKYATFLTEEKRDHENRRQRLLTEKPELERSINDAFNELAQARLELAAKAVREGIPFEDFLLQWRRREKLPKAEKKTAQRVRTQPLRARTNEQLGVTRDLRARHLYLVGKSGCGKTTLLKNLIADDFDDGTGCAFIDPHGDAALDLLGMVPEEHLSRVIYFDPSASACPPFNPLALPFPPAKLTDDLVSAFKMFYGASWGPQLEHILRFALLTLITDREPQSLAHLRRMLTDERFREEIARRNEQESIRLFWANEFPSLARTAVNPILNKLSALLAPTSHLERLFSRTENILDFRATIRTSRILVCNLSKGALGEEASRLLGGFLTAGIQQAALSQAEVPEQQRPKFSFYVDEFQNYVVASFETILSEARKYNLQLTLANQTLSQLPSSLTSAIFGNVATLVAFNISADDAGTMQREMHATRYICRRTNQAETLPFSYFLDAVRHRLKLARDAYRKRKEWEQVAWENSAGHPSRLWANRFSDGKSSAKRIMRERHPELDEWQHYILNHPDTSGSAEAAFCARLDELERQLNSPTLSLDFLRDVARFHIVHGVQVASDLEIFQETAPSREDFLNLPPHTAYVRIERAENVSRRSMPPPRASTTAIRDEILARQRELYPSTPRQPTASSSPSLPPSTEQPPRVPPRGDDFDF